MDFIFSAFTRRESWLHGFKKFWRGVLRGRAWWIVAILLLALLVRLPGLTRSVWEDEVSSFLESRPGYDVPIFQMTGSLPTSYWTSFKVFAVCDWLTRSGSVAVTRLPMLALALGGVWLAWRLGRLWRNWLAGFVLALLLAVWPFKADWDTQVRYYCVLMFLALLQWLACEAWRLRPESGARCAAVAIVTLLASLSYILAPVLLAVPWIYLAWIAGVRAGGLGWQQARAWWKARGSECGMRNAECGMQNRECGMRNAKGGTGGAGEELLPIVPVLPGPPVRFRRRWGRLALELGLQAALLASASFAAVEYNRGADWLVAKAEALAGPRPQIRLLERPGLPSVLPETTAPAREQLPTPRAFAAYARNGFKTCFDANAWSPAPLVGQSPVSGMFIELVRGRVPWAGTSSPYYAGWILVGMLAGSLALLLVSPPLLVSLWLLILVTGALLQANQDVLPLASRYYTIPGLAGVVLLGAGLAGAVNLARWPLAWLRPRWSAWAGVGVAVFGFLGLAAVAGPAAWRGAGVEIQDWKGLVRHVPEKHPGATLFVGIGAKCINFYRDLAAAGCGGGDYWNSPLRSRALEKHGAPGLRDLALIQRLNAYDSVALFRYAYWNMDVKAFVTHTGLVPPFGPLPRAPGIAGAVADLGQRVYVTRGRESLLLRPRLRDPQSGKGEAGRRWRLDCIFEVPGVYELSVITPRQVSVTRVTGPMNQPLSLAARPLGSDEVASATQAQAGGALPYGLGEDWRPEAGERLPAPGAGARAWSGQFTTNADPATTLTLTLWTDAAPGAEAPVVRFRLIEPDWVRLTSSYDIGIVRSWEDRDNFYFAAPLRMQTAAPCNLVPRLYLEEMSTNKDHASKDFPIEPDRGWRLGDVCLLGPLTIPKAKAQAVVGKMMVLGGLPLILTHPDERNPFDRDPFVERRHIYRPLQHYCVAYVRFVQEQGVLRAQFALPRD